jgi:hypothetical protein
MLGSVLVERIFSVGGATITKTILKIQICFQNAINIYLINENDDKI